MNWHKKQIVDMVVEIQIPVKVWRKWGTPEYWKELERKLEQEIKDIEDFIHDHRSRDHYNLFIEKKYETICGYCGYSYGHVENTDVLVPECCEQAIAECGYRVIEL